MVTHRGRNIANVEKCKNKTLLQQPKKCNQMASTACWIGTYSSFIFFSLWWCPRCYTFDLGAMAQSTSLPWQTAACIDCLTQTFEDTLKWQRPDGRDYFSMSCHNGKTEYKGQVLDKKKNHTPGWCNESILGIMLTKRASVYSKMRLLMTAKGSSSTVMCLKCQDSLLH